LYIYDIIIVSFITLFDYHATRRCSSTVSLKTAVTPNMTPYKGE